VSDGGVTTALILDYNGDLDSTWIMQSNKHCSHCYRWPRSYFRRTCKWVL